MINDKDLAPNLLSVIDYLDENRVLVATNWVKVSTVKPIFTDRKISIKKFRDSYAIPIIDYFIAVVRGEKLLGDCPIMGKFVRYMVTQGITPKEIFDICMGFRRSLISFLLKNKTVSQNTAPFMDEISIVFDANLSGVLDIFTDLYASAQKKIETAKSQKEKLQQTLKIINSINTKIIIVQNGRIILANKPFLEMTGVRDLKELYKNHKSGFDFFSEISMYENEYKNNISDWIEKICENNKPFQSEIYHDGKNKKHKYSGRITQMPVEGMKQYIITLSNISDHVKDEKAIEELLNYDELTGFRKFPIFEELLSKMIDKGKKESYRLFLAVVDIPDLRNINDTEGNEVGDMVISEVAEDLRLLVNKNIYLSRLNGSRFGVLLQYDTEQSSYDWCIEIFKIMKKRRHKKTVSITEVDLTENINNAFLRVYSLVDETNNSTEDKIGNDFEYILEYKELSDQNEFIKRFSKMKTFNATLFYKELPLSSDVKINFIENENVAITLTHKQIKVAEVGKNIYFKLDHVGTVKASIKDIDFDKRVVVLDSFIKDTHSPLNRIAFRVEAGDDVKAYISENDREYKIKILDINNEYIAVKIDRKRNFDINSLVYIDMLLPITDVPQSSVTNATITRIDKIPNGYKMVFLCHFDDSTQELLSRYIAKQQMEIIKSIQE